jgi:cell division protein FtsX
MKISFQMAMWMCVVFAIVAFAAAATAFSGLSTLTDAAERDAAAGFGWFWTYLGVIAVVFGVLSWMITHGKLGKLE